MSPVGQDIPEPALLYRLLGSTRPPRGFAAVHAGSVVGVSATGTVDVWTTPDRGPVWLYDPQRRVALASGRLGDILGFRIGPAGAAKMFARFHAEPGLLSSRDTGCGLGVALYMGAAVVAGTTMSRWGPVLGIYSPGIKRTHQASRVWDSLWGRELSELVEDEDTQVEVDVLYTAAVIASGNYILPDQ